MRETSALSVSGSEILYIKLFVYMEYPRSCPPKLAYPIDTLCDMLNRAGSNNPPGKSLEDGLTVSVADGLRGSWPRNCAREESAPATSKTAAERAAI